MREFRITSMISLSEVEIDHPLVPMELLPVRPLPQYSDVYDFRDPGWTLPPSNSIAKIAKWFSN